MGRVVADQSVDALVAQAYAAIAKPETFVDLLHDIADTGPNLADLEAQAAHHFDNAASILDEIYPTTDGEPAPGMADAVRQRPSDLVLGNALAVRAFDPWIFTRAELKEGAALPEWMFDPVTRKQDERRLSTRYEEETFGFVRLFVDPDSDETRWFSFRQEDGDGEKVVLIDALRLRWNDDHGQAFADAFGLTATEAALVQHLVSGGTIRAFAEDRGRSVGTARNQMKALLRKLVINTKEKLLLLYAGFVHSLEEAREASGPVPERKAQVAQIDGAQIAWEEYGDPHGAPVLYFHPLEGPLMPPSVEREARLRRLRIIAPWRPFYGETSGDRIGPEALEDGAKGVAALLDLLDIPSCIGLAAQAGTPYMAAFARYQPERLRAALAAGPFLPLRERSDFSFVKKRQRAHLRIARTAPAFARIFQRAMLATVGTKQFSRFAEDFYEDCPAELAVVRNPEMVALFQRATAYAMGQSSEGLVDTMLVWASDWSALLDDSEVPMEIMIGSRDCNCDPQFATLSAARHGLSKPVTVDGAGSFLVYEAAAQVMSRLAEMAGATARR